jgi:hypothetical protein
VLQMGSQKHFESFDVFKIKMYNYIDKIIEDYDTNTIRGNVNGKYKIRWILKP